MTTDNIEVINEITRPSLLAQLLAVGYVVAALMGYLPKVPVFFDFMTLGLG